MTTFIHLETRGEDNEALSVVVGTTWWSKKVLSIDLDEQAPGYYVYSVRLEGETYIHFPTTSVQFVRTA